MPRKAHVPVTLDELDAQVRQEKTAADRRRSDAKRKLKNLADRAEAEGRKYLTDDEETRYSELTAEIRAAGDEVKALDGKLDAIATMRGEEEETMRATRDIRPTGTRRPPAYDRVTRVGAEERTYRPDTDPRGDGFLRDVTAGAAGDLLANERLTRHMHEERTDRPGYMSRAVGTGAFTGLVVPQYLTDLYAPATAALRPFADVCNKHDLPPSGMTVNISRITTATGVALQATEGAAVSEQDIDDTLLTENVQTAAGQQTVSRQALERGTLTEDVVMEDLFRRYATTLDSTLINQATTGLSAVAQATTYTDADPTAPELWPFLFQAQSKLETALLAQAVPSHFVMHPRRWNWLTAQVSSTWPFLGSASRPAQTGGLALTNEYGAGVRGILGNGMLVVVDANVPTGLGAGTNQDEIYCVATDECHLWEDPNAPVFIRAEQAKAANLQVLLVLYGFFSYSLRRYTNGAGKIGGTGLIAPAGF